MQMYATPFTAALILEKFKEEKKIDISAYLEVVALNSKIKLGNFEIDFVTLTFNFLTQRFKYKNSTWNSFTYRRLEN